MASRFYFVMEYASGGSLVDFVRARVRQHQGVRSTSGNAQHSTHLQSCEPTHWGIQRICYIRLPGLRLHALRNAAPKNLEVLFIRIFMQEAMASVASRSDTASGYVR